MSDPLARPMELNLVPLSPITEARLISETQEITCDTLFGTGWRWNTEPPPTCVTVDGQQDVEMAETPRLRSCGVNASLITPLVMDYHVAARERQIDGPSIVSDETPVPPLTKQSQWASKEDWLQHKPKIIQLYWNDKKTLTQVKDIMEREHNLRATRKMYRDRLKTWGFKKNLRREDVVTIVNLKAQRDAEGKQTEITRNGAALEFRRVVRYLERTRTSGLLRQDVSMSGAVRREISHTVGIIRLMTPPPATIRAPDELQTVENILVAFRTWIDGNFSDGTWFVRPGESHIYTPTTKLLINFDLFLHTGHFRLIEGNDEREAFRILNLAFASLREAMLRDSLRTMRELIELTVDLIRHGGVSLRLGKMLWDYAGDMWQVSFGQGYPMACIWQDLGTAVVFHHDRNRLRHIARLLPECVERHIGLRTEDTIWFYKMFWEYENRYGDNARGLDHEERGIRRLLSTLQADPGSSLVMINTLQYQLAGVMYKRYRDEEARDILREILETRDSETSMLMEGLYMQTMKRLGDTEAFLGNWTAALEMYLLALRTCDTHPRAQYYSLSLLEGLERVLIRLEDEAGVEEVRKEMVQWLRIFEERAETESVRGMMGELQLGAT